MAIQPSLVQYEWSKLRRKKVEVGRLYDDGFLFLKDDPGVWIQSNPDSVSSVRSLELYLMWYKGERIGDSIGELSQLTHLYIYGVFCNLKCLPNTLSRLHNLHHLELSPCEELEDLPPNFGDLYNLTYLSLKPCHSLKLIESVAKLSNLTTLVISRLKELPPNLGGLYNLKSLTLHDCENYVIESVTKLSNLTTLIIYGKKLEELPANLGDLKFLASLFLYHCYRLRCLPWSITKLSNLRILYLPEEFRLETLPPHLNDSIIISVAKAHIRKTWKELKTHVTETLSYQFPIIPEELTAQKTSTPGYLQFKGDPTLWIRHYNNYGLHSSVRVLEVDLGDWSCKGKIPDSIGELSQLTHLYISDGCLPRHLPLTFSRLKHLSLTYYTFECHTISHFDSLGNLSTLTSLHLNLEWDEELPKHIDLPISLTHLSLECCYSSIPDSFMASMAKLSNLNTLTLSWCCDLESLPLHLNLTKLILRDTTIKSLPIGLKHLEIIHVICRHKLCKKLQECWRNQLVNLETLSYTCYNIESLSSVTSLHNLRELQLKDCFSLKELPQDLDKLEKLCTLDVSGTRIQSLPNSIINLHNLRRLILPKCFKLDTLPPDFENKVMISVDDTDESYYKHQGYHYQCFYKIINDCDYMTSDSIKEINEKFLEKFKQATSTIIEQASPHRPSNHQPDATRIIEGSLLNGSADPTCNNNHNAFFSSLTQEVEILPTRNEACRTIPDVVAEFFINSRMDFEAAFNTDISNFPYRNNIPAVIMDNLVGWNDVEADGNCGFRCVAEVYHGGQENWPMARRAILNELKAHPDVYQKIYRDDYDSALQRIDWGSLRCGEVNYMKIVVDLFPIANFYQCIVICFFVTNDGQNPQLSATVLPWNVGAHSTKPTKEFTIAHLGIYNKHYILLDLKDDFPVPPISRLWYDIIDKTVVDWDSPFVTRRQSWDRLTNRSRDSIHLDVIDDCNVNGGNIAVGENISQPNFSSQNHETGNLQSYNWDGVVSDMAAEPSSKFHETNLSCENSQQAFQNGEVDNINLELEQGTSSSDSPNSTHGGSYNRALVKRQNKNPQGGVKHKSQKIEIPYTKHIGDPIVYIKRVLFTTNNDPNVFISSPNHKIKNLPTSKECYSDVNANTVQDHDPMDIEDYLLPEENNAVDENNSPAVSNSQNQETEIWQSNNQDGVVTDKAAEPSSNNLHETNSVGLSNQQVFQNERIANILELEQGTSSSGSLKAQDNNSHRVDVQHKTQKIRDNISLERINELKSQNLTLEAAASKEHLDVSRSTLKRRLKELGIKWSSKEEGMNPDTNRKKTHSTCERNLSQPNSMDASNPVSHGQGVEHIAGSSQPTLSYHVPSEHNVVNNSTPDVVTTTVGEPPLSTQYCMDSRLQRVEEHPNDGATPALVDTDLPPNERCSTFVVKATSNEDTAKFNFSLRNSIEELKDVVSKQLELEVGTFKIKYNDIDNELVLMNNTSNLEEAVSLSRKSGSNVVRLSIFLKT